MKSWPGSLLLALALTAGASVPVQAQTFEQSLAAYAREDYRTAFEGFKTLAEQGDASAQLNLGVMYQYGQGAPKDELQAFVWYSKAAEQGHATAQRNLGWLYRNGQGVPRDDQLAVGWFRKAAEQGNALAQYDLGWMHGNGRGVPTDEQQAAFWYQKAAEQGHAQAQGHLGSMYHVGRGVPKDERRAAFWYQKAAEQGSDVAQYALGMLYGNGQGVPKDDQLAAGWYRKAAEQGVVMAQGALGAMYFAGEGVPKDQQIAYFWFLLAGAQGDLNAVKLRDFLESSLSPAQRAAAQVSARNWKPKTAAQSLSIQDGSSAGASGSNTAPANAQADSTGSGFRVARGAIVTNHHVIHGCSRLRVNGTAAQVRGSDARSDLALLGVTLPGPSASLRTQRAAVGEPVAVAGYPLRGLLSGFNMTTGTLSSLSGMGGDTRYLQITAPVQPGNSGGPMLDSVGNLMGVVVSKLDAIRLAKITGDMAQNVNFAIHANVLRTFLDANSVDYDSASSDKPLAPTAIADKARGFTVLVECWK